VDRSLVPELGAVSRPVVDYSVFWPRYPCVLLRAEIAMAVPRSRRESTSSHCVVGKNPVIGLPQKCLLNKKKSACGRAGSDP
jgi:hypothetical protein